MNSNKFRAPRLIAGVLVVTTFFTNCGKDKNSNCISYEHAFVSKVDGDRNGRVNQEMTFQVYFGCHSGCGQFSSFQESVSGNTRTVIVNAKYEGCICTADAPTRMATYKFTPSETGVYYLKFRRTENTYLTDTLIIQ